MEFKYKKGEDYDKVLKDNKGGEWQYYSKRKIKKILEDENKPFKVVGEVVKNEKKYLGILKNDKNELKIGKLGTQSNLTRKVVGYIQCNDDEFIAVVKGRWMALMGLLIIFSMLMYGGVYLFKKDTPKIDPNAKDYVANIKRPDDWDPTRIAIPGYEDIKMKTSDGAAYVALWNPDENPCYFEFEILLKDNGERLYQTGLIPPGQAVTKIPIELSAGEYDITIKINTYSLKDHKTRMNGADINTKLIVLEG